MSQRIFISSVQREFAKERKALAEYVRKDAILGRFFDVFLFEEVPAQERKADGVYLSEVDACDIYLGIFGHTYGNVDSSGVSATEREYLRAAKRHKTRICFVDKSAGDTDPRQAAFISRVNEDVVRKGFVGYDDLRTAVYAALAKHLEDKGLINVLPFDASKTARVQLKHLNGSKIRAFVRDAREKRGFKLPLNAKPMDVLTALDLVDEKGRIANSASCPGHVPSRIHRTCRFRHWRYHRQVPRKRAPAAAVGGRGRRSHDNPETGDYCFTAASRQARCQCVTDGSKASR